MVFFYGGIMAAGGFDGEADFAVDVHFALPFIMAPNDFILHAGGQLFSSSAAPMRWASSRSAAVVVMITGLYGGISDGPNLLIN